MPYLSQLSTSGSLQVPMVYLTNPLKLHMKQPMVQALGQLFWFHLLHHWPTPVYHDANTVMQRGWPMMQKVMRRA